LIHFYKRYNTRWVHQASVQEEVGEGEELEVVAGVVFLQVGEVEGHQGEEVEIVEVVEAVVGEEEEWEQERKWL